MCNRLENLMEYWSKETTLQSSEESSSLFLTHLDIRASYTNNTRRMNIFDAKHVHIRELLPIYLQCMREHLSLYSELFVSKETTDITVTRGTLWSDKVQYDNIGTFN